MQVSPDQVRVEAYFDGSGRLYVLTDSGFRPAEHIGIMVLDPTKGSHVYGYTAGALTTDTWTLNGKQYRKTFTYTNGVLTGESDWVQLP